MRGALIALVLVACGGKPAPKPPPPLDPKRLAKLLDGDLAGLEQLAQRHRGDCTATTAALTQHVERMKQHEAEVENMMKDPAKTKELKSELAAFAAATPARSDRIATALGATYLACDETARYSLERAIAAIPTYD